MHHLNAVLPGDGLGDRLQRIGLVKGTGGIETRAMHGHARTKARQVLSDYAPDAA